MADSARGRAAPVDLGALIAPTYWRCPRCNATDATRQAGPHTRMHPCPSLGGLATPMVPTDVSAKVTVERREDYVGVEQVQRDGDGRPVMAVVVTRDDGEDRVVYAPTATARRSD